MRHRWTINAVLIGCLTASGSTAADPATIPASTSPKQSPYQPIMRRNGKLFAAGFRDPARPEQVAETILAAITSEEYRLRWLVGKDAVGLSRGRAAISDEAWVAMGDDLSDDYNRRFFDYFGIRL